MSERFQCRAKGCNRVFDSSPGRGSHEGQAHDRGEFDYRPTKEELEDLYYGQGLSGAKIGEIYDVVQDTIYDWMQQYDLDRKEPPQYFREKPPRVFTDARGYERVVVTHKHEQKSARIHQLILISKGEDPSNIFSNKKYNCHHRNGLKWDNRPENLELLSVEEHASLHADD